jgi:hypothetical protein
VFLGISTAVQRTVNILKRVTRGVEKKKSFGRLKEKIKVT